MRTVNLTHAALLALITAPSLLRAQTTHYGMSSSGGEYGIGTIWSITEGNTFTKRHDFFRNEGSNPKCDLVKYGTKLYGVTELGGASGDGTIFSYDPATGIYSTVAEFTGGTTGSNPIRGLTQSGTKLYGTCSLGGSSGNGTLFEFDPSTNALVKKVDFSGTGAAATGSGPRSRLLLVGATMYGTTFGGGATGGVPAIGRGTIFSYVPGASSVTKRADMNVLNNGYNPTAGLVYPGSGSLLYGVAQNGGAGGNGTIYTFNTSTFAVSLVYGFSLSDGKSPIAELIKVGSLYYGTTTAGGANNLGTLFSLNPTGPVFLKHHDMASATGFDAQGRMIQAASGLLFGQSRRGGTNDNGVIFSFNTSSNTYAAVVHMNTIAVSDGVGGLIEEPAGTLYGVGDQGGPVGSGALFKFVIGTGTLTEQVSMALAIGSTPKGRFTMAPNGKFYGLTSAGGTNSLGILFSFDPGTNTLTKLVDLSTTTGSAPLGSMALHGGKLYGLCRTGGANGGGTLFEFDPATNIFTKKVDLSVSTGMTPLAGLMVASNGKLYGATTTGGTNGLGTLFDHVPGSTSVTVIRNLATSDGTTIEADLFQASNGLLYGVCAAGGSLGDGTLFRIDPSTNAFTKLYDFDGLQGGSQPAGELVQHSNGKLYGTCRDGGAGVNGSIWSWTITPGTFTPEYEFDPTDVDGKVTESGLLIGGDGNLYGTCVEGGTNGSGTLFRYVPGGAYTVQRHLTLADGRFPANGRVNDVVPSAPGILVSVKAFLEGPYVQATNLMKDSLRTLGYVPLGEPYTALGFAQAGGGGGETTTAPVLAVTGSNAIVDWIRLELRSAGDPTSVVATKQCLIQRDGDIVGTDGVSSVSFTLAAGSYYVAVRHRNHLSVMTSAAVALGASPVTVDFTLPATTTYGTNARKTVGTAVVLWAGNVLRDSPAPFVLKYTGASNDRDPILSAIGGVVPTNTVTGYGSTDVNMDGTTKYTGLANDRDVILSNIGGVVPTNTRTDQLP